MKTVGIVGVSGTGKSTLMTNLLMEAERTNKIWGILEETTVGDINTYLGQNPSKRSTQDISARWTARVEFQMLEEKRHIEIRKIAGAEIFLIDKPTPVLLMYYLMYATIGLSTITVTALVKEVQEHSKRYDLLLYLPRVHDISKDNLERVHTNKFVLSAQDAVLKRILDMHVSVPHTILSGNEEQYTKQALNIIRYI